MSLSDRLSASWFQLVHRTNLVYNTCWEDPRLDRQALRLGPDDCVLVITSAGCNALDYALDGPRHIHTVDMNPKQNALLELKRAGIRTLDYDTFFSMFGRGRVRGFRDVYESTLRPELPEQARRYWDSHQHFFSDRRGRPSFYFRGTSGFFARAVNRYLDSVAAVRDSLEAILAARSVDEQREIYERQLRNTVWSRWLRWIIRRDTTLSLLGVPRPQRVQVERDYTGGIGQFIEDCVEAVFARLPLADNYFWRVYLTGEYTADCCPEYLKRENFERLKGGLVDRISTHTDSVTGFLRRDQPRISHFVLLDHMDWLSTFRQAALAEEWQAIVDTAAPGARILWRSGGLRSDFVDRVIVRHGQHPARVGDILNYNREQAENLHALDRVHTYGSFWIANLAAV